MASRGNVTYLQPCPFTHDTKIEFQKMSVTIVPTDIGGLAP